jgi:hypothetical protein
MEVAGVKLRFDGGQRRYRTSSDDRHGGWELPEGISILSVEIRIEYVPSGLGEYLRSHL